MSFNEKEAIDYFFNKEYGALSQQQINNIEMHENLHRQVKNYCMINPQIKKVNGKKIISAYCSAVDDWIDMRVNEALEEALKAMGKG